MEPRLERFIGVIYRPDTERWSHYGQAILRQFDGWVWFYRRGAPREETYPFGLWDNNEDERAIRELVDKWMEASRAGDTAAVLELMTDDVPVSRYGTRAFREGRISGPRSEAMRDFKKWTGAPRSKRSR